LLDSLNALKILSRIDFLIQINELQGVEPGCGTSEEEIDQNCLLIKQITAKKEVKTSDKIQSLNLLSKAS
jgi:hypothetical protein